jgi:hypothetical protein
MEKEIENEKCHHDLEPYRGQMRCKKCNRLIYCVTQPKFGGHKMYKTTKEKVSYDDIFKLPEGD